SVIYRRHNGKAIQCLFTFSHVAGRPLLGQEAQRTMTGPVELPVGHFWSLANRGDVAAPTTAALLLLVRIKGLLGAAYKISVPLCNYLGHGNRTLFCLLVGTQAENRQV